MALYADDPQAWVEHQVTDRLGGDLDFNPVVHTDDGTTLTAQWQGDPGPARVLRVNLFGLSGGNYHALRLVNPDGPDADLGLELLHSS